MIFFYINGGVANIQIFWMLGGGQLTFWQLIALILSSLSQAVLCIIFWGLGKKRQLPQLQKEQKQPEDTKMISEERAAWYKSEGGLKLYGGLWDRREGESDEDFRRRSTILWLAEAEDWDLYGQFCIRIHPLRNNRPPTLVPRKPKEDKKALNLQASLLQPETQEPDELVDPNLAIQDLEGYLDESDSELDDCEAQLKQQDAEKERPAAEIQE